MGILNLVSWATILPQVCKRMSIRYSLLSDTALRAAIGYFKASNTAEGDQFGHSISLSADGSTLAVGAYLEDSSATGINGNEADKAAVDAGAVYVFTRVNDSWQQEAYLKASNTGAGDRFGYDLSLSGDGSMLAVGAYFEDGNATGINGDQANNDAANAGAVYVYIMVLMIIVREMRVRFTYSAAIPTAGSKMPTSRQVTQMPVINSVMLSA